MPDGDGERGVLQEWMEGWGEGGAPTPGSNPALPAGVDDLLSSWARDNGFRAADGTDGDPLQAWAGQNGFVSSSRRWYSGANADGTANGWNTQFYNDFLDRQNKAFEEGRGGEYFAQPDATGIVTWDHEVGGRRFVFGDVVENGERVANVYEDLGRDGGNALMAQAVLTPEEQAQVFTEGASAIRRKDANAGDALDQAVQAQRQKRNTDIPKGLAARAFERQVDERTEGFTEGIVDEALVGGSVVGGAALGAGVGSVVPVVGTGVGAVVGGAVGFLGGWLNKDEITRVAARAYEVTALSQEENGGLAAAGTFLQQFARVGGKFISPVSNIARGGYDVAQGTVGDQVSEFNRVDPITGERLIPTWMKVVDVGAAVADAGLQFASSVGVAMFSAQMGGEILGGTGELAFSGGKTFDERRGGYDNIFVDDNGNFDPLSGAAGIANIGIDVLQLGMGRGLAGKANATRRAVGEAAAYRGLGPAAIGDRIAGKLPRWLGGQTNPEAAKAALAAGGKSVNIGGFRFTLDEAGQAVSRRGTLTLLAPSEQLAAVELGYLARRGVARQAGAVSADDFYRAALALSTGRGRAGKQVLVNAFGEGYEEAAQAVLEPLSHDGRWSADEIADSFLYGAAAGAGMTGATALRGASSQKQLLALAKVGHSLQTGGGELSDTEWAEMSEQQIRGLAALGVAGKAIGQGAFDKMRDDMGRSLVATSAGVARLNDAVQNELVRALNRANTRTDGAFVMVQHEDAGQVDENGTLLPGSIPGDAISASAVQTLANLTNHLQGVASQQVTMQRDLANHDHAGDPDGHALLTSRIQLMELTLSAGQVLLNSLANDLQTLFTIGADGPVSRETVEATVAVMNEKLRRAFTGRDPNTGTELADEARNAMMRASTLIWARDPHEGSASYQALAPHISAALTAQNAQNVIEASPGILKSIRGDHDGDKMRPLNQLILDDEAFVNLRTGRNFLGVGNTVNIAAPAYERWIIEFLSEGLASTSQLNSVATGAVLKIRNGVRSRFAGRVEAAVLDRVLDDFTSAVRANDPDARAKLLDSLAQQASAAMGIPDDISNEWLYLDQLVRSVLQEYQEAYAAQRPTVDADLLVQGNVPTPVRLAPEVRERRGMRAATEGQTLAIYTAGTSMFRKFQKLHYSSYNAPVESAAHAAIDNPMTLQDMVAYYEELGQGITRSELDRVRAVDDIVGRVFVQLERLAAEFNRDTGNQVPQGTAMVLLANTQVQDVIYGDDGSTTLGKNPVSLAQMLLRLSVLKDKQEKSRVLEFDPQLQAKYAKLERMTRPGGKVNAEKTFVEVFGTRQLYTLLGDSAKVFRAHLTVEQFVRQYTNLPEDERRLLARDTLMKEPEYLGAGGHHKLPYSLEELFGENKISAYRSVVDSILAVGNNRISMEKDGKLVGDFAKRSTSVSEEVRNFIQGAQRAIREFMELNPSTDPTEVQVQQMLEAHPDFARQMFAIIPDSIAPVFFTEENGEPRVRSWFYKTLTFGDAREAEMHLFRNLLLSQWSASALDSQVLADETDDSSQELRGRRFANLPLRMMRVMYMQAANDPTGVQFSKFFNELMEAKSIDEFYRYVNTTPGVRGRQAPLVPWFDDVSEFDEDKAGGGWAVSYTGSDLREAITALQKGTTELLETITEERASLNADLHLLQAAERVIAKNAGSNIQLRSGDREIHARIQKVLEDSSERYLALGPAAMVFQSVAAVQGFFGQGHTKAKNPENVQGPGAFEALRDAFGHITNHERFMAALTAQNLDDLTNNMSLLAKDGVRTMDDHGRPVEWTKPTVEDFIRMYKDPTTRAMVRAAIFPQVMERDPNGNLRSRLLVGKSLPDLLNGKAHQELFGAGTGNLGMQAAMKYVAAVEAEARRTGGSFSVQRLVNDLVIARTAGATRVLSEAVIEDMVVTAYYEVAQVLQQAATLATSARAGTDLLAPLREEIKKAQRSAHLVRTLELAPGETVEVAKAFLADYRSKMEMDAEAQITELVRLSAEATDPNEKIRILGLAESARQNLAGLQARLDLLVDSTQLDVLVESMLLPESGDVTAEDIRRRDLVLQEVRDNLRMVELVPELRLTLLKLRNQLQDPGRLGQPDLSVEEWHELSRGVIAMKVKDYTEHSGNNVHVPLFPTNGNRRYYDTSFSYLVDDIFDKDSDVLQAAVRVNARAGRLGNHVSQEEIVNTLNRTIFDGKRLGRWNSQIVTQSIEANQRLDSAAAELAVSMAGNAPKRQAVISAATRRTFQVPDESMLSTVTLSPVLLRGPAFSEVPATIAGYTNPRQIPLIELNNRFASSVLATMADGTQIELTNQPNVGLVPRIPGDNNGAVAASPYVAIHVDRINSALDALAVQGLDATSVQITFLHPDSQPAGEQWYNNVFFEGLNFELNADMYESLNAGLYFAPGGVSPDAQASALDAAKKGLSALQVIIPPTAAERALLETGWETDLASVLRYKTKAHLEADMGFGPLDPNLYNAVLKNYKLRHFVLTVDPEGSPALLSAEQVIELQRSGAVLPPESRLWIPTDDMLRTMLGEQGTQGIPTIPRREVDYRPDNVALYKGVPAWFLSRFPSVLQGETAPLESTRIANRARQTSLLVSGRVTRSQRSNSDARVKLLRQQAADAYSQRAVIPRTDDGFNPRRNLERALNAAKGMIHASNIRLDWTGVAGFVAPRNETTSELDTQLLQVMANNSGSGLRTGFIYKHNAVADLPNGLLSDITSMGSSSMMPVYQDVVLIDTGSFLGDLDAARETVMYFANRGVTLVLAASDGTRDLSTDLAAYLNESIGYERIPGTSNSFRPSEGLPYDQTRKALESTLVEVEAVSPRDVVTVFKALGLGIQEGSAWINEDNDRLGTASVVLDLVTSTAFGDWNVPVRSISEDNQVTEVIEYLNSLNTAEGIEHIQKLATRDGKDDTPEARASVKLAFERLITRINSTNSVLPAEGSSFQTGDFIPLVNGAGGVMLYRHGHRAPASINEVNEQIATTLPGDTQAAGIAVYSTQREPAATTHVDGTVREWRPRSGFGLSVMLDIPLQYFGDKKQLEFNGMKYLLTPMPKSIQLPDHGFFQNRGVDILSDLDTAVGKESVLGEVTNARNAIAFFGMSFLTDATEFFFPGKGLDDAARQQTYELLHAITRLPRVPVSVANELVSLRGRAPALFDVLNAFADEAGLDRGFIGRLQLSEDPSTDIAAAMIVYLMTPGAQVAHVLESGGLGDTTSPDTFKAQLMPQLFTQVFDNAAIDSPLRKEFFRRINAQIYNPRTDGTGYKLRQDWAFEVLNADPGKNMLGTLQFAKAHSAGDNPVTNGMAFVEGSKQAVSPHSAMTAYQAIGGVTAAEFDFVKARLFAAQQTLPSFELDQQDGGLWRMLTRVPKADDSFASWMPESPLESQYRSTARDLMVMFRSWLEKNDSAHWSELERKQYRELALQIVRKLNLQDSQLGMVDGWVRQMLGMPAGELENEDMASFVTGHEAVEAAKDILRNVTDFYLPVFGGEVNLMHLADLQIIYRANAKNAKGWKPRATTEQDSPPVTTWDDWVTVSLGSMVATDSAFEPMFLTATDGFMHTYQGVSAKLTGLPVSKSVLKMHHLMSDENNALVTSLSDPQNALLSQPALVETVQLNLDELLGGKRIAGRTLGKAAPASVREQRRRTRERWRKENDIPFPVEVTFKDFRKNGAQFIDHTTTTNGLFRALINIRVGTTLLNPSLYVSMIPEQFYRMTLDTAANLLTGQSTGALGGLAARAGVSQYDTEQLTRLRELYSVMGQRADFKGMVYSDLMYQRPYEKGTGRGGRALEAYARLGSRWQDPTWGVRADALARRYVEAALEHIYALPTMSTVTTESLVNELMVDPTFLKKRMPDAHRAGTNAIAQMRSLKQTTASAALAGVIDTLATSSKMRYNVAGNLLKIPLLFRGYALNVATTMLGLQGFSDMTAMFLDGRDKPGLIRNIQKSIKGEAFDADSDSRFDMSNVIEGIDLSRSFIRGGLNLTGLFALGMMAGNLGLSGEDEETKRRRRAAEFQGAGFVNDPRRIENDFRNNDVIFLDWMPATMRNFFARKLTDESAVGGARYGAQMHWTVRQFVSPIIGMERFFETGDFRQVQWGFEDALSGMPIINSMMWKDANDTVADLNAMAESEGKTNGPLAHVKTANFLMSAVGTYESMLFENAFINTLYSGLDRLDRDPYALVMRDSAGNIQRDVQGSPRGTDRLEQYVDPVTGEVKEGYAGRSAQSAALASLTENRATLAVVASLFTGFRDSDYLRSNMVPKIRSFDKATLTEDEQQQVILDIMRAGVQQPMLTTAEATSILRNYIYERTGSYAGTSAEQLLPAAERMVALKGRVPLSELDPEGDEVLTLEGARAVYQGLVKGTATTDAPGLANIYISPEMRKKIQAEWTIELVQEGIDLGLDESKAHARMMRLMTYGDPTRPDIPPIKDIIWNKQISFSKTTRYQQLNTTYVMGPDGLPWATGFPRGGLFAALGLQPLAKPVSVESGVMTTDARLNSVDLAAGRNLGLRALEPRPDVVPTEEEISKSLSDALQGAAGKSYTPTSPYANSGAGYSRYGRGGGGGGYANWRNMYALPENRGAYSNTIPFINTNSPIIRRATIRRERVWSDRGRLNSWQ